MKRKLCGDCGQPSLETDTTCWACGSTHFADSDRTIIGDRTIMIGHAAEKTTSWTVASRQPWAVIAGVASACAFALFMCVVGYWLGRATAPEATVAREEIPQVHPIPLPTPPTGLVVPQASASAGLPAPVAVADPPVVSVRPQPGASAAPRSATGKATIRPVKDPLGEAPVSLVYQNPRENKSAAPGVVSRETVAPTGGGTPAPSGAIIPLPTPQRNVATVTIRNDAAMQLEVAVDGSTSQTAVIAPGGAAILNLSPGRYQLRASGGGISSPGSVLAVGGERRYSLTVNRRQENGQDSLSVTEPAVDGVGG